MPGPKRRSTPALSTCTAISLQARYQPVRSASRPPGRSNTSPPMAHPPRQEHCLCSRSVAFHCLSLSFCCDGLPNPPRTPPLRVVSLPSLGFHCLFLSASLPFPSPARTLPLRCVCCAALRCLRGQDAAFPCGTLRQEHRLCTTCSTAFEAKTRPLSRTRRRASQPAGTNSPQSPTVRSPPQTSL